MLSLAKLQQQLVADLTAPPKPLLPYIKPTKRLTAAQQLAIYQGSIFAAKQQVLSEIYSVCQRLVGSDFFLAMIHAYIPLTPSYSWNIADYGEDFYQFIATFAAAKSLPYLADVAQLELAWHKLSSASQPPAFDFQKLANCYEQARHKIIFNLPPQSTLLTSAYPIQHIFAINQSDYVGDDTITLANDSLVYLLVWRKQVAMRIDILSEVEWQVLSWMQAAIPLAVIAEKIHCQFSNVAIETLLPHLVAQGWVSNFSISNSQMLA